MRMIIVSGLSGSGKSIALQTLEDLDYYCIDNLPLDLLLPFAETMLSREHAAAPATTAVSIDARNFIDKLVQFPDVLSQLRNLGLNVEVLFLQADDDALIKRFSETRRKHPLSVKGLPLAEAIRHERQLLAEIATHAELAIDSSHSNIHELRELIRKRVHARSANTVSLLFESFGFKNGVPVDADFVFDVRCLPNPHWEPKLRPLTGLDKPVMMFLANHVDVSAMVYSIQQFLQTWLEKFAATDRNYLTVAIGCTGGRHRSVYVVDLLAQHFSQHFAQEPEPGQQSGQQHTVVTRHRELEN